MIGKNGVSLLIGHNGVQDKTTLNPANETVERGIYDATTLSAVDADLATANIKNGITMFGFAGSADVFDISDATATEGEVLNPETFYAVAGGIRTGTMPTVAIAPGSSAYPAGYHVGDGGGLPAIDADLVTANIKSGITIFNVAGHNDVRDISDADLVEAEAPTGKFFYAVSGGRRTGSGTKTLNPANETVAAGYYAATTLSAVDAQLAVANIKSGVNIFGFVGAATIQDISAADAVLADVKNGKTFFSVTGGIKTGNLATVALAAGSSAYPAGYHAGEAGGLVDVDADLVTGNIKFGITIFNVAGHTNVRDSSDADLTAPEAPTGKTFYAGGGAKKTGSGTKTLSDANENVAAGYYAATTLSAVDAHLAAANILSGVTIFGFTGPATVQDIADADLTVGEAPTGKFFYAVTGGRKTGTGTKTLNPANETVNAGYYAATTLSAVDVNLAAANIKDGVNIFGFVGTLSATLAEDTSGSAGTADVTTDSATYYRGTWAPAAGTDVDLATCTPTFDATSIAVAVAYLAGHADEQKIKLRIYMGGVQAAEGGFVTATTDNNIVVGFRALAGAQICKVAAHNYQGYPVNLKTYSRSNGENRLAGIGVGSIKTV